MLRIVAIILLMPFALSAQDKPEWTEKSMPGFELFYTGSDKNNSADFESYISKGNEKITGYFEMPFRHKASVYIFPTRSLLDKQWQKSWGDSAFKSECWMVASGVAERLDVLSPLVWTTEKCEHNGNDKKEIQEIICHELVHCFHAQYNPSPDFSGAEDMDWFIEGLATFVSGQLTSEKRNQLKELKRENKLPNELKKIWTGKYKYAMAGSVVEYISVVFGKKGIIGLMNQTKTSSALSYLNTNESSLIKDWKEFLDKKQ